MIVMVDDWMIRRRCGARGVVVVVSSIGRGAEEMAHYRK
jgi:hypothetical protein